ncbi:MAG: type II toxin-antitoxin system HicB family antitoxin [Dehalococcoidia bacterium]|nr:type II toxin-antitoxin system HicB family antitoxin [Dehalococcoidia bacterium]
MLSTKKETREVIQTFLSKPYPVTLYPAEEGGYVAEVEDLPGCLAQGETAAEAMEAIEQCRKAWIEVAAEDGIEIPPPRTDEELSGKFLLRVPKSLHRRLASRARRDDVSLNTEAVTLLASALENKDQQSETKELVAAMQALTAQVSAAEPQPQETPSRVSFFTGHSPGMSPFAIPELVRAA